MQESDVALTYADLQDAKTELDSARGSPKSVRRAFTRYVDLTQRLTSAMRADYARNAKGKWHASRFRDWSSDTSFLKWLRNEDQHASAIYVQVLERQFYKVYEHELGLEITWELQDQLMSENPTGARLIPEDPRTGKHSGIPLEIVRTEYLYLLMPRSEEVKARLAHLDSPDLHEIATRSLEVYGKYHEFFLQS